MFGAYPSGFDPTVHSLPTPDRYAKTSIWLRGDMTAAINAVSLLDPLDLSSANWTHAGLSAFTTGWSDPDGGTNACKYVENSGASGHWCYQIPVNARTNITTTLTASVKKIDRDYAVLFTDNGASKAWFNLTTGTLASTSGASVISSSITDLGGGWFDIKMTFRAYTTISAWAVGMSNADGVYSYTGDGASSMYAYNPRVTQNTSNIVFPSLTNIDTFGSWVLNDVTTTVGQPDAVGGIRATKLTEGTATTLHRWYMSTTNMQLGVSTTVSVTAKSSNRFMFIDAGTPGRIWFNLPAGTVGTVGAGITSYSMTAVGNGFYRCTATFPSADLYARFNQTNTDGGTTTTGDGSSYILAYDADVSQQDYGAVSQLDNRGNSSALTLVNHTAFANMPLVTALGGRPAWLFRQAPSPTLYFNAAMASTIPQPFTLFWVAQYTKGKALNQRVFVSPTTSYGLYFTNADALSSVSPVARTVFSAGAISTGTSAIGVLFNTGGQSKYWVNGVGGTWNDPGSFNFDVVQLGGNGVGGSTYDDPFGEFIVYAGDAEADGALTPILNYLMTRYGL